jgi:glycosyltransferase involved in cell wall biosynthesis
MDIAIVPLSSGAGTKLKVFDYMSVGLPIVTTKKGVEGIDITEGTDAIVVEDVDSEFITAIEELIENPSWRQTLGDQARILAETEYNWDTIGGELRDIYAQIIADLGN